MKKFLSLILSVFVITLSTPMVCFAEADFTIDKLSYTVLTEPADGNNGTVRVSAKDTSISGDIVIPKTVTNSGADYTVTSIKSNAFLNCTSLTSVTIPDSVTSIGGAAFTFCTKLTSITIPDSVTSIGISAFVNCTSLTSVTIPDRVTSIGDYAFHGCTKLTSITIPDSVTLIGLGAFGRCISLEAITVDSGNANYKSINGVLFNNDITTLIAYPAGKAGEYTIPDSVTSIGNRAFYGCSSLEDITIPDSVEEIGENAFLYCYALATVTIPASVVTIGDGAFGDCFGLTTIKIPCNFDKSIFTKNSSNITPQDGDTYTITYTSASGTFEYVHNYGTGTGTTPATYLADGIRTYTCQDCGEQKAETIPKLTHDDPTAGVQYWGTREVHNGHEMYVDDEGKTSALVTGNEKIWLREESYDPVAGQNLAAWYMLDNTSGEFEAGSRFWVQWLNNKDNPIEFLNHFNNIDQTIRDRIDSNRVWIFLVGVTKPDGTTEYKTLSQEIPLYIQMGTDWDYSDIKAIYISDNEDEEVNASYLNMEYPGGKGEFAKLGLKHFSPYAIYDYLEAKPEASSSNQVKTGDETGYILLMSSSMLIIAGLYLELCMKKKRN